LDNIHPLTAERNPLNRYRTIFLSDFHLGTIGCRASALLAFLQQNHADTIYLIGDIVDTWTKRTWSQDHMNVLYKIISKAQHGAQVFYISGNHDTFAKDLSESDFGNIHVGERFVHTLIGGSKLLVLHGDLEDDALKAFPWMSHIAAAIYDRLQGFNHRMNAIFGDAQTGTMGLFAFMKRAAKKYFTKTAKFEKRMLVLADKIGCAGVVCGHMHEPALKMIDGLLYANAGDWVENCSALVEHFDGRLEILTWLSGKPVPVVDQYAAAVVI